MGIIHRILKKPFFGRFQGTWRWPQSVPQDGWERIAFTSGSGATLAGVFGAARVVPPMGGIVLAHPMGFAAKGFWLKHGHAGLLRDCGFHVLAFDFNGFGESESSNFDYPADVLAAGDHMRQRFPALPLGVLGCSFGAGWALCAMAKNGHPFRAAVLEAMFPSLPFYWRRYPLPHLVLRALRLLYPRLERDLRPIRAAAIVKATPCVLLIYGDNDPITPADLGNDLRTAMAGRAHVEMWTAQKASHTLALLAQPDAYAQKVVDFLSRAFARMG